MSDKETDDEPAYTEILAGIIKENARPWHGYWAWMKDKQVGEHGAAQEILTAAGIAFEGLISRDRGQDPPDCEAVIDGKRVGIEVTELVDERTLGRSMKAIKEREQGREPEKPEAYVVWDRAMLLGELQKRIEDKDQGGQKGGPYHRYFLVICTDETFLNAANVEEWLTGAVFQASRITDVLFGLSYHSSHQSCPVFPLRLSGAASCL
jgi:hypothetical protein